jgi:hypothetical protein
MPITMLTALHVEVAVMLAIEYVTDPHDLLAVAQLLADRVCSPFSLSLSLFWRGMYLSQ